jgi:hypothetical protein
MRSKREVEGQAIHRPVHRQADRVLRIMGAEEHHRPLEPRITDAGHGDQQASGKKVCVRWLGHALMISIHGGGFKVASLANRFAASICTSERRSATRERSHDHQSRRHPA